MASSFSNDDEAPPPLERVRDLPRSRAELPADFLSLLLEPEESELDAAGVFPLKLATNSDLVINPSLSESAPAGGRRIFLISELDSFPSLSSSYWLIKFAEYFSYFAAESEFFVERELEARELDGRELVGRELVGRELEVREVGRDVVREEFDRVGLDLEEVLRARSVSRPRSLSLRSSPPRRRVPRPRSEPPESR